jgi:chaperonin cofactor prefoldin
MSEKQPITLTAEQVIALVGHGATQEQLDGVRWELNQRIDRVETRIEKVDEKIEDTRKELSSKIEASEQRMNDKIDGVRKELGGKLDRLQWFIVAAALALIFKDYLFKALAGA